MNFKVTIEDAKRLLPDEHFRALQAIYGDGLAEALENAEQPPELGIASNDKYLTVMLYGLLPSYLRGAK